MSIPAPLTSFTLFPTLPTEIRLKVIAIILSIPRTVTIICNKEPALRGKPRTVKSFTSPSPIPALLHVNRETRFEALSVYTAHFQHPLSPCATYVNLELDTVKLPDGTLLYLQSSLPEELNTKVRRLALETRDSAYFGHFNMEILKGMKGLKEVQITTYKGVVYSWEAGRDYVGRVVKAFEDAKREDPGWVCPRVTVLRGDANEEGKEEECAGIVEGGALIPGWTEEIAHLFEDDD